MVRGFLLSLDDEIRRELLLELFCNFRLDMRALSRRFGIDAAAYLAPEIERLQPMALDGLLSISPSAIEVSEPGRYFIRNLCMTFDRYLAKAAGVQMYSRTV
jgi:oxygen-independent coproporphyrinogen-3 oxidase